MQQDHHLFCPSVFGSFVISSKVLGLSDDKNGVKDEESDSLPTGFKTVYKIFENFQIKSSLGCWSWVIKTNFQR